MDPQLRARAETRLERAAATLGLADPRPPYRERLRQLRETHPDAFQRAIAHYESVVLPAMADGDALTAWLDYAGFLAGLTAAGELHIIDESGRARTYSAPLPPHCLVLFIPHENREDVLIAAQPDPISAAQQATIDLLVHGKLAVTGTENAAKQ